MSQKLVKPKLRRWFSKAASELRLNYFLWWRTIQMNVSPPYFQQKYKWETINTTAVDIKRTRFTLPAKCPMGVLERYFMCFLGSSQAFLPISVITMVGLIELTRICNVKKSKCKFNPYHALKVQTTVGDAYKHFGALNFFIPISCIFFIHCMSKAHKIW